MTSHDPKERSLGQNCIRIIESDQIKEYLDIGSTFLPVLSEKWHLNIFPLAYNGQVSEMTWTQVTEF